MPSRAYEITTAIDGYRDSHIVHAETAGKARYKTLLSAQDAGYELPFQSIRARSLGVRETPQETAARRAAAFNAAHPVGTPVRVYPGPMGDEGSAYDTVVAAPGAYVGSGSRAVVKVPGDSIEITHVVALATVN
jgi:hypothetical protein